MKSLILFGLFSYRWIIISISLSQSATNHDVISPNYLLLISGWHNYCSSQQRMNFPADRNRAAQIVLEETSCDILTVLHSIFIFFSRLNKISPAIAQFSYTHNLFWQILFLEILRMHNQIGLQRLHQSHVKLKM